VWALLSCLQTLMQGLSQQQVTAHTHGSLARLHDVR
jgi:hypothetical protein